MKKTWKRIGIILMGAMLALMTLLPSFPAKADADKFNAEIKVGFDNKAEMGHYVPFTVTVENLSNDFSGRLQLIVPNKVNYNIMYESDISIGRGEKKTVTFYAKVLDNYGKMRVRVVDKKGKVVWTREDRLNVDSVAAKKIDVGILSDDYSALGYMDNVEFYASETFKTNLMELTADTFPESVNGLDMLEVIVISNFSTDLLTDKQIEALNMWVNRGGLLIIGTGSNSSKTLSKIKGNVLNVTPQKMTRYTTSFGLPYYAPLYQTYGSGKQDDTDPRNNEEFMQYYDELFYNYREDVDELCLEDFMYEYGVYEDELENGTVPYYLEQYYYDYCIDKVYLYAYGLQDPDPVEYNFPTASADVLEMETEDESETIYGDAPGGDYTLGYIIDRGAGHIALYGIDFTMNPIPNYSNASEILYWVLWKYTLPKVDENYKNQQNSYMSYNYSSSATGYRLDDLLDSAASAPVPPTLFYAIPIIGYLVAILVLYLVNKKKKKTFRLWIWYPILSVILAVLIYCIGFSTRVIRPRVNAMTVLELQKPAANEKNYVAVTTPSNRTCEVSFSKMYNLELIREIQSYFSSNASVDSNSYRVAFREGVDDETVRFSGNVALSSDRFLLESIYPSEKTFTVDVNKGIYANETNAEKCVIHNETGQDLENVFVVAAKTPYSGQSNYSDSVVLRIGDMKAGDTFDIGSVKWKYGENLGYSNSEVVFTSADKHILLGFLFGSLSDKFVQYTNRKALADYLYYNARDDIKDRVNNTQNYNYTGTLDPEADEMYTMYIIGFPKNSCCKDIQFTKKYRNERTEAIVQKVTLSQMNEKKN